MPLTPIPIWGALYTLGTFRGLAHWRLPDFGRCVLCGMLHTPIAPLSDSSAAKNEGVPLGPWACLGPGPTWALGHLGPEPTWALPHLDPDPTWALAHLGPGPTWPWPTWGRVKKLSKKFGPQNEVLYSGKCPHIL